MNSPLATTTVAALNGRAKIIIIAVVQPSERGQRLYLDPRVASPAAEMNVRSFNQA
jgi:hypothetical protein